MNRYKVCPFNGGDCPRIRSVSGDIYICAWYIDEIETCAITFLAYERLGKRTVEVNPEQDQTSSSTYR